MRRDSAACCMWQELLPPCVAHITLKLDKAGQGSSVCVGGGEGQAVTAKQQGRMMMLLLLLLQRKMFWRCTFCHISGYISNTGRGEGSVAGDVVVSGCGHSLRASRESQRANVQAGESRPNTTHMHMRIGTLTLTHTCMHVCIYVYALVFVV